MPTIHEPRPGERVSVAIANDYEIIVRGLAAVLAPHEDRLEIVELDAGEDVDTPVDVVLYDVFGCGEANTGDVRDVIANPRARHVVLYSANVDAQLVETALDFGASGYLSKGLDAPTLVDAIVRVAKGETVVELGERAVPVERRWPGLLHDLPEREAEVLALITQGHSNAEIARRLYISPNTLKSRIRKLYRHLGFENRVQAALWGREHGFGGDRRQL